jgi:hypothetical protein
VDTYPRCRTCSNWQGYPGGSTWGVCAAVGELADPPIIDTHAEFCCVLHNPSAASLAENIANYNPNQLAPGIDNA